MRGVFSSRIYIADFRRDSVSTYFGKRCVTVTILIHLHSLLLPVTHLNHPVNIHSTASLEINMEGVDLSTDHDTRIKINASDAKNLETHIL